MKVRKTRQGSVRAQGGTVEEGPAEAIVPYFEGTPLEFCESADVEFHCGEDRLPAHSQVLAGQSHFMAKMFQDLKVSFSKTNKFAIPAETLAGFTSAELERFLVKIYNSSPCPIQSAAEAHQLYRLADLFDCPKLRAACSSYLVQNAGTFLEATTQEQGVLKWLMVAEEFDIAELQKACITFTAKNYGLIQSDARLKLLPSSTLVEVMNQLFTQTPQHTELLLQDFMGTSDEEASSEEEDSSEED